VKCEACGKSLRRQATRCSGCGAEVGLSAPISSASFEQALAELQAATAEARRLLQGSRGQWLWHDDHESSEDDDAGTTDEAEFDPSKVEEIERDFWLNRNGARSGPGRLASTANLPARLAAVDLDPDIAIEDLLDVLESARMGVELWTSAKRGGASRYRCRLYRNGPNLRRVVWVEAATAWEAVAAAVVTAFEEGEIIWR
jgi:hypothetical protein